MLSLAGDSDYFNLGHAFDVPSGRSDDDVLAAISTLVSRHEGLRTPYPGWATHLGSQQPAGSPPQIDARSAAKPQPAHGAFGPR